MSQPQQQHRRPCANGIKLRLRQPPGPKKKHRKASYMDIKKLIAVATGEIEHAGNGLCPDRIEGFDSRDPDCPACKILIEAEGRVAEMEAERAQAEGYVTALRYIAWTAAGYMECVHVAKQAIGETGAVPPPPKTQPTEAGGCK